MQKETKKVKEKVKADKDCGVLVNLNYDYVVDIGDGRFESPVSKKRYREVNINTSDYIVDNKNRY